MALRDVVALWRVEVDVKPFDRVQKRIELAERGLKKLDKAAKHALKVDKVAYAVEGMKINYIKQQNALLERQERLKKRLHDAEVKEAGRLARRQQEQFLRQQKMDKAADMRRKAEARRQSTSAASTLMQTAAVGTLAVGGFAAKAVKEGMDAREQENLLEVTFGERAQEMKQFSAAAAQQMGRSRFDFQESVGQLGIFITNQLKDLGLQDFGGDVAEYSKGLSRLIVDLSSLYNVSEKEARQRVFSGLAGETEAVRKLGVDLSDAALEALNKKRGSTVAYNQLTQGEKTQLRIQKMFMDTQLAQGDAIRTANDLSNVLRSVEASFRDLLVETGQSLMPVVKEFALFVRDEAAPAMRKLFVETTGLRSSFEFLAYTATAAATAYALSKASFLQLSAGAAVAAGAFLAFDEIRAATEGKKTIILDLISELFDVDVIGAHKTFKTGLASVVAGLDIAIGGVIDVFHMAQWAIRKALSKIPGGFVDDPGEFSSFTMDAVRRARANASGIMSEEQQKRNQLDDLAARGQGDAFTQASPYGEATNTEYLASRSRQIASGRIMATSQDVTDGLVPAQPFGPASPQQMMNSLPPNITVNVASANATPEQISKAVAEGIQRATLQVHAAAGEEGYEE